MKQRLHFLMQTGNATEKYLRRNHCIYVSSKYSIFILNPIQQPGKLNVRTAVRQARKKDNLLKGYILIIKPEGGILPKSLERIGEA